MVSFLLALDFFWFRSHKYNGARFTKRFTTPAQVFSHQNQDAGGLILANVTIVSREPLPWNSPGGHEPIAYKNSHPKSYSFFW